MLDCCLKNVQVSQSRCIEKATVDVSVPALLTSVGMYRINTSRPDVLCLDRVVPLFRRKSHNTMGYF